MLKQAAQMVTDKIDLGVGDSEFMEMKSRLSSGEKHKNTKTD